VPFFSAHPYCPVIALFSRYRLQPSPRLLW